MSELDRAPEPGPDAVDRLIAAIAYHEAGHAVAAVLAFRDATLSPVIRMPPLPVKYVEIIQETDTVFSGLCFGPGIYSVQWPAELRIAASFRDMMEWQLVMDMAGGVAEAIHRGTRRQRDVFWELALNCNTGGDLEAAALVLDDLRALTGRRHSEQRFAERAYTLLRRHWGAVEMLAWRLIEARRVEGDEVLRIVMEHAS